MLNATKVKGIVHINRATGSYGSSPSGKTTGSTSLGCENEATEGGPDLLYHLIKINFLCPMVKVEPRRFESPLWLLLLGCRVRNKKAVMTLRLWFMRCESRNKRERSSDVARRAKQTDDERGFKRAAVKIGFCRTVCSGRMLQADHFHVVLWDHQLLNDASNIVTIGWRHGL